MDKFIDVAGTVALVAVVASAAVFFYTEITKDLDVLTDNKCKPVETAERQLVFIAGKAEFVTVLSTTCAE